MNNTMSLNNKVALITGSGSGIGAATALLFAREGADIVIVDINEERAKNISDEIEKIGKRALTIIADVSQDDKANEIIKKTIDTFGKLDILINNAGIFKCGTILNGDIMKVYNQIMNTNLRAVILLTSLATPYLVQTKGCIVNISSVAAHSPKEASMSPVYAVAKAGLSRFTKAAASELAAVGVRVNAVAPGPVATNIAEGSGLAQSLRDYASKLPLGRISEPSEIAELILYLVGDKARSITGSCYVIDNGMMLK